MMILFRRMVAVMALFALTFSLVEEGWATACAVSPSDTAAAEWGEVGHAGHVAASHEGASGGEERGESDRPSPCPMTVAPGMACGVIAIGAAPNSPLVVDELSGPSLPRADLMVASGALSSLFRPPQK